MRVCVAVEHPHVVDEHESDGILHDIRVHADAVGDALPLVDSRRYDDGHGDKNVRASDQVCDLHGVCLYEFAIILCDLHSVSDVKLAVLFCLAFCFAIFVVGRVVFGQLVIIREHDGVSVLDAIVHTL